MMRKTILGALLMVAAAPAVAQTAAPAAPAAGAEATIYKAALGPGWENWSWATVELGVDNGPRKPIRVEAKAYQALYLHHAPFSTRPYRGVSMLIQPMAEARLRVLAIADGKPIPDGDKVWANGEPQPLMRVVTVKPGGWTKLVVPLKDLGAEDRTVEGFWIQNDANADAPNFYVADIELVP